MNIQSLLNPSNNSFSHENKQEVIKSFGFVAGVFKSYQVEATTNHDLKAQVLNRKGRKSIKLKKERTYWTDDKDQLLIKYTKQYGRNWDRISSLVGGHSPDSCRVRHSIFVNKNLVEPSKNATRKDRFVWTPDEDATLLKEAKNLNEEWLEIVKFFPGRTSDACRRHYRRLIEKLEQSDDFHASENN